jgi:cyclopropane-fatty-acyl-phospholipid synthase
VSESLRIAGRTEAPSAAPGDAVRAPGAMDRRLRAAVLAQMARLRSGAVVVHDGAEPVTLGDASGPLGCVDLHVHDPGFWRRLVFSGDVGAGEAFVDGAWSSSDLVRLLRLFVRDRGVLLGIDRSFWSWPRRLALRLGQWLRRNTRRGSAANIRDHYDLGDELFARILDPSMTYSAAWFEHEGQSLADAQAAKLRRLGALVDLGQGDHVLEIGTGWGSFALTAAQRFGARVTTTTISANQAAWARARVREAGLEDRIQVLERDYRDLEGTFDRVVSCEMIEAVGARFLPTYLRTCAARLRRGGLLGLQAITIADQHYDEALRAADYIQRHVFPGSFIPSATAIVEAATRHTDLRLERFEQFGPHYATTIAHWRRALLRDPAPFLARGGPSVVRAWDYYFAYCESGFREGHIGVAHLRFARP